MRRSILAALLAASASAALAAPTPKEQLLVPPANATHFVVVSTAGKHGDEYAWTLPDGRMAFRESILLRGLIFEQDETMRVGPDGMPADVVIRGVTPSGDSAENFAIANGNAAWASPVDKGSAAYGAPAYYLAQGGPFLSFAPQIDRLLAAGRTGLALLPSGKATFDTVDLARCRRGAGKEARRADPASRDQPDAAAGVGREWQVLRVAGGARR